MSLKLLLREHPQRALAILTDSHALILRHSLSSTSADSSSNNETSARSSASKCMVEFTAHEDVDLTDYRVLRASGVHGTLGLININADVFLCVISGAVRVATVRPDETVQRILSVDFYCLNRDDFDYELHQEVDPYYVDHGPPHRHEHTNVVDPHDAALEHPCSELKKILSGGTFYYSLTFDLTNRLQHRLSEQSAFDIDNLDDGFLWNSYMIDPLIKFRSRLAANEKELLDSSRILTSAIRGFVSTITVPSSSSPIKGLRTNLPSTLTLISRLSCRRAGTRFNSRGIDDDGNVANFVETETVFYHPSSLCFSYAQIRGSIPIFWEQATGLLPGQQKIQITRSPEATQPAFDKHFESLGADYGSIHILNLLSESKPGEAELTARYNYHVLHSPLNQTVDVGGTSENRLIESQFDFHAETRGPGGYEAATMVKRLIQDRADGFVYFLCEDVDSSSQRSLYDEKAAQVGEVVILQQEGIFRTNCLDCLDRTNLIQTIISQMALEQFLQHRNEHTATDFWVRHSSLWADNGDALSKIYAGTGALKSSFTRHGKMSLAGAIADARKSATRMYINNFADKGRQNTIDMLLGRLMDQSSVHLYDPVTDFVSAELKRRFNEYSTPDTVQIWVGTFNLNGRGSGVKEDLTAWLWPDINQLHQHPGIVAVGFQEIVELSPQQIMSTDPVRRQAWENAVRRTLNDSARKHSSEEYILLRSGQLVGAALMIFVKAGILKKIKNVEGSVKKTGMSGMAGNKGAVAIRLDYASTRICFVTAHLAAGFANYEERNRDYRTISTGLRFQRNRSIEDHDAIIWLGDFNYRVGLSDDKARQLIKAGDLDTLYQNDQLNLQMVAGHTFPFYSESRITFMPTYKYNNGSDDYDTSEKARIPAWCDRILRKGEILKQINYTTAPLRFSDHRPVYGTFQCAVSAVDEVRKETLSREIYAKRRSEVGDTTANARNDDIEDEDIIGYESIAPELPPASSDRRKWWLDNGLPARSNLKAPDETSVLNVHRPQNPFTLTDEPDWKASKTTPGGSHALKYNELKHPNSHRLSPIPDGSQPLPLDTDPDPLREEVALRGPNSRSSSQSSLVLMSSNVAHKAAPPIPKKPALLSNRQHSQESRNNGQRKSTSSRPPAGALTAFGGGAKTTFPPPPQRTKPQGIYGQQAAESDGPPLPPRSTGAIVSVRNGLMDDDNEGASAIPSLQPMRRQQ